MDGVLQEPLLNPEDDSSEPLDEQALLDHALFSPGFTCRVVQPVCRSLVSLVSCGAQSQIVFRNSMLYDAASKASICCVNPSRKAVRPDTFSVLFHSCGLKIGSPQIRR